MLKLNSLKIAPKQLFEGPELSMNQVKKKAASFLRIKEEDIKRCEILKLSIDARKKPDVFYLLSLCICLDKSLEESLIKKCKDASLQRYEAKRFVFPNSGTKSLTDRPLIVGMGPAGLFCAYELAKNGYRPILIEQGAPVEERYEDITSFWEGGPLKVDSNVQFGEGGAGTFSDGKLNTLVKDKEGLIHHALSVFVENGAPQSILYDFKPHLGTDRLMEIVKNMRNAILSMGGDIFFHTKLIGLSMEDGCVKSVFTNSNKYPQIPCSILVLAIGHSSRDTFSMLHDHKITMEQKPFAVGLRVEHPQSLINESQYGMKEPGCLGAAPYKLTYKASNNRSVFSFCMCPGGYVVNASSEPGRLAINGMSYSERDSKNANSAIVMNVDPSDYPGDGPLDGIAFQRQLEEKAYHLGLGSIPVERLRDYYKIKNLEPLTEINEDYEPCMKGKHRFAPVHELLPDALSDAFLEGMSHFGRVINGFGDGSVLVSAVESRTSSPVRITRNEEYKSLSACNLYPCGEGAGYAGGITSAAVDGLKIAMQIGKEYRSFMKDEL